jgi:hypothetical protein
MSNNARARQRHVVAMTVFVDAEGMDVGDAHNVAWRALEVAITGGAQEFAATGVVVHTYQGYPRSATIIGVVPTTLAFTQGALVVWPAASFTPQT